MLIPPQVSHLPSEEGHPNMAMLQQMSPMTVTNPVIAMSNLLATSGSSSGKYVLMTGANKVYRRRMSCWGSYHAIATCM